MDINCPNCGMGSYMITPDMEPTQRVCSYCGLEYFTDVDYKEKRNAEIRGRIFYMNIIAKRLEGER